MENFKRILVVGLFSLISACGGGGGGGGGAAPVSNADINTENSQALSIAATEGTRQAVNTDLAGGGVFQKTSPASFDSKAFSEKITQQLQRSADLGELCVSGNYTSNINQVTGDGSITFNNCDLGFDATVSGTLVISSTDTSFTLTYVNFSVTFNGTTEVIDFTMDCTILDTGITCTSTSSITGIDGRTYTVSNITVNSNADSTFNVDCVVVDPDNGQISVNAQSVIFDCPAPDLGRPSSGSITFSSNGSSGLVTFDSCSSYTVTVDGVGNSFTWN